MFVDSLLINRWLCEDNIQHIVQTMMLLHTRAHTHTHSHHRMCARVCACSFFSKQSQVHLLISLFQKCAKAFQVREQGFLNRCHLVSTQHGAAFAKQNQLCCLCCRKVQNKKAASLLFFHTLLPVFSKKYLQFIFTAHFHLLKSYELFRCSWKIYAFSFFKKKSLLLYLGEVVSKVFWISEAHTCSQTHRHTQIVYWAPDCQGNKTRLSPQWSTVPLIMNCEQGQKRRREDTCVYMSFYHENSISVHVCVSPWFVAKLFILNNKRWGSFFSLLTISYLSLPMLCLHADLATSHPAATQPRYWSLVSETQADGDDRAMTIHHS